MRVLYERLHPELEGERLSKPDRYDTRHVKPSTRSHCRSHESCDELKKQCSHSRHGVGVGVGGIGGGWWRWLVVGGDRVSNDADGGGDDGCGQRCTTTVAIDSTTHVIMLM